MSKWMVGLVVCAALTALLSVGCGDEDKLGCRSDGDCSGIRVCEKGTCEDPPEQRELEDVMMNDTDDMTQPLHASGEGDSFVLVALTEERGRRGAEKMVVQKVTREGDEVRVELGEKRSGAVTAIGLCHSDEIEGECSASLMVGDEIVVCWWEKGARMMKSPDERCAERRER